MVEVYEPDAKFITTHSFELMSMNSSSGNVKQTYQAFKNLYFGSDRKLVYVCSF
jgi:hypothetical protein